MKPKLRNVCTYLSICSVQTINNDSARIPTDCHILGKRKPCNSFRWTRQSTTIWQLMCHLASTSTHPVFDRWTPPDETTKTESSTFRRPSRGRTMNRRCESLCRRPWCHRMRDHDSSLVRTVDASKTTGTREQSTLHGSIFKNTEISVTFRAEVLVTVALTLLIPSHPLFERSLFN